MNKNTAILIFANSAKQESSDKRFTNSEALFEALNKQTIAKVKRSGLPYFHFSEKEQQGASFGERYTNAIQFVYDQGFDNIITIGNDTPHLQTSQLVKTAQALETNPIVLGPSRDGGYYLMGLHKSQFNTETFLKLPWQTSQLTQSISRLLSAKKINVVFLQVLQDIDSVSDVKVLIDSFRKFSEKINALLLSIITSEKSIVQKIYFLLPSFQKENYFNKGSPLQLHFKPFI
ncbi:DUF2064 domain-containing protein [Jejudonia soesokkakensis]|uniref:DUF2064 domain-containing protein n=1 Tax=Jejudonia soesokkakensis TaxID=1323432 RepID=A0ABW2MWF6_9FLAO